MKCLRIRALVNNFENLTVHWKSGSLCISEINVKAYQQNYYYSNIAQKMSPRPFKSVWGSPPQKFWEPPLLASSRRPSAGRPSCTSGRPPKSLRFGSLLLLKERLLISIFVFVLFIFFLVFWVLCTRLPLVLFGSAKLATSV
jgi:hypothetical protein